MRPAELLLGETLELKSGAPPETVLERLELSVDPRRLGLITDSPGERGFIGSISGPRFQLRQRHTFSSINRFRPTVIGTVMPEGNGSVLRARFRADPWYGLAFLLVIGGLLAPSFHVSVGAAEALLIVIVLGINLYQYQSAKRPVRELLRDVTSDSFGSLRWVMS